MTTPVSAPKIEADDVKVIPPVKVEMSSKEFRHNYPLT
jgi:hypothetical protein